MKPKAPRVEHAIESQQCQDNPHTPLSQTEKTAASGGGSIGPPGKTISEIQTTSAIQSKPQAVDDRYLLVYTV